MVLRTLLVSGYIQRYCSMSRYAPGWGQMDASLYHLIKASVYSAFIEI